MMTPTKSESQDDRAQRPAELPQETLASRQGPHRERDDHRVVPREQHVEDPDLEEAAPELGGLEGHRRARSGPARSVIVPGRHLDRGLPGPRAPDVGIDHRQREEEERRPR